MSSPSSSGSENAPDAAEQSGEAPACTPVGPDHPVDPEGPESPECPESPEHEPDDDQTEQLAHPHSKLELSLVNDLRELARVAAAIDTFCSDHGLGTQLSYAIDLAVDEILSYSISNAYDNDEVRPVELAIYLDADEVVLLIVSDGADLPMRRPDSGEGAILGGEQLGELGLFLVHQVMDTVRSERQQGCNVIVMTKRLPTESDESDESEQTEPAEDPQANS